MVKPIFVVKVDWDTGSEDTIVAVLTEQVSSVT